MTVGHMCFDKPQPLNSSPPDDMRINRVMQPSHQDFDGQLKVLREDRDALLAAGDSTNAGHINNMINDWWKYRLRNGFAEPVFAIWNTVNYDPDKIPSVQDMSLSLVYDKRLGTNALLPVPRRGIRATSIRGTTTMVSNMVVYKIGRSTGYTECRLSTLSKSIFWDLEQNFRIQSYYVTPNVQDGYDQSVEMGDSGAWLIDGGGQVMGMVNSAACEDIAGHIIIHPLAQAFFMPINKCLDLCSKYLGESVHIMT